MLTALILRHDNQINIASLLPEDGYTGSMATALYQTGVFWRELKEKDPDKLEAPMRVLLMQGLLSTVLARFEQMLPDLEKQAMAIKLGWLNSEGSQVTGMKWGQRTKKHIVDPTIQAMDTKQVTETITELVLCKARLVVN